MTCSAQHGQDHYAQHSYREKLARINNGETKIILLEEIPKSQQEEIEEKAEVIEKKLDQCDYQKSVMYESILLKKQIKYHRDSSKMI